MDEVSGAVCTKMDQLGPQLCQLRLLPREDGCRPRGILSPIRTVKGRWRGDRRAGRRRALVLRAPKYRFSIRGHSKGLSLHLGHKSISQAGHIFEDEARGIFRVTISFMRYLIKTRAKSLRGPKKSAAN